MLIIVNEYKTKLSQCLNDLEQLIHVIKIQAEKRGNMNLNNFTDKSANW